MKATFELVIRDEDGNIVGQLEPYQVNLGNQTLHEIEVAVDQWRQQALPDIEEHLLTQAQHRFTEQRKKRDAHL